MTARRAPKYPFRPREKDQHQNGGFLLTVIPLVVMLFLFAASILWQSWRADFCN